MATIYKAREREETSIPITEVLKEGRADIFPELQNKLLFGIRFRDDKLIVTAGKHIGLIHLNERVAIEVEPKIPTRNLVEILLKTDGDVLGLRRADVGYRPSADVPRSVLNAIAESYVRCLRLIEVEGLAKEYMSEESCGGPIKGRVEFKESLQRFWSRGLRHSAVCTFFEQSADIFENRLLRYCCYLLLKHYQTITAPEDIVASLSYFDELFSSSGVNLVRLESLDAMIGRTAPSESYNRALKLAAALVLNKGIELPVGGSDIFLPSFLVDMETLFESYMRRALSNGIKDATVLDGNKFGGKPLFDDKKSPAANPDIVVRRGGEPVLLVEVKYKPCWSREDLNQIITYAVSYGVLRVVLIMPSESISDSGLSAIGTLKGITIYRYGFQLGAVTLDEEEARLSATISTLLMTPVSTV